MCSKPAFQQLKPRLLACKKAQPTVTTSAMICVLKSMANSRLTPMWRESVSKPVLLKPVTMVL